MPFARQVSIGRVALVQYPEAEAGKLVVISDVVSANSVSGALHARAPAGLAAPGWPPAPAAAREEAARLAAARLAAARARGGGVARLSSGGLHPATTLLAQLQPGSAQQLGRQMGGLAATRQQT